MPSSLPGLARRAPCALLCAAFAGCAGDRAAFRPGAPVEVERKPSFGLETGYRQDGKLLDVASLVAGLERVEAARDDAQAARHYSLAAGALAGAGGVGIGYGIATGAAGEKSGWTIAAVGAGLAALAVGAGHLGKTRLDRAVEAYNAQQHAASAPALVPWVASVGAAPGRCTLGGLAIRF